MNDDAPFQLDRTLYERARSLAPKPVALPDAVDPVLLAAYLDGRLDEADAAPIERLLAADPAALEALVDRSPVTPEIPSAAFIHRAQGLRRSATVLPFAPRPAATARVPVWAAWGAVAASLVLISLVGFDLGMQTERNFNDTTGIGTSIDILDQSSTLGDGVG